MINGSKVGMLAALLVLLFTSRTYADLDGGNYKSDEWNVRVRSPKGWQVSDHSTYPGVLLWMLRHEPNARMLFSAEKLATKTDYRKNTQTYATEIAKRLESLGYTVRAPQLHSATGAYWMDFDDGKSFIRQAVLIPKDKNFAYTLTMSADDALIRSQLLRVFDYSLRSIKPLR